LAIDREDHVGADDGADATARAATRAFVELHWTIAARVELLAKGKDMLRARLNTQAASLATVSLNGDRASGHERSPLSDSSAMAQQGGGASGCIAAPCIAIDAAAFSKAGKVIVMRLGRVSR
jgi:hypothetical protein